jgi:AcrR family transcriptional regulator
MNFSTPKRTDKAKEIARAALKQFTLKGFVAASLEKIAAEAGIGKSTIYEYYKNKDELFVAAVEEACQVWFRDVEEICRQTGDPMQRLALIATSFLECPDYPPKAFLRFFFEILMQTITEGGVFSKRKHFIREVHQRMIRTVADILLTGVSSGDFRPEIAKDAGKIAITYLAYLDGMMLNSLLAENYIDINAQLSFFLETFEPVLRPPGRAGAMDGEGQSTETQDIKV